MSTYHHGDLRQALVAAGLEALAASGPEQLGLRGLARRVGVSPAAPYRHFRDRQALLRAVAAEGFESFAASMAAARGGVAEADQLAAMAHAYVHFALTQPQLFRLMFSPGLDFAADPVLKDAADKAYGLLTAAAAREDSAAPGEIAMACWAFVHGLAILLLDRQLDEAMGGDADALIERLTARFISGLRSAHPH